MRDRLSDAGEAVEPRVFYLQKPWKHSRSSGFQIRVSFVSDLLLASMEFERSLPERVIPLSRSKAWHGIYGLDLGLLEWAGRV